MKIETIQIVEKVTNCNSNDYNFTSISSFNDYYICLVTVMSTFNHITVISWKKEQAYSSLLS